MRRTLALVMLLPVAAAYACAKSDAGQVEQVGPEGGTFAADGATPTPASGEVYGHSDNALYRVDTGTRAVQEIGFFTGCTHVVDLALDQSSNIYASTGAELWLVENGTARCTRIASGTFPNSLSFVPAGVLDPQKEVLVGFNGGEYVRIDIASGKVDKVGELGGGFESSGDIVSVKDGKTYVTVKGPGCADCIVEIDPVTGKLTKNWGPVGYPDAFGLAFWAGELYAFTDGGKVLLVTFAGDELDVKPLEVPNAPAGLAFRGAGSTTSAPVGPVR